MAGSAFAHPLIDQVIGVSEKEQDPRIMQRAAAFQQAQQQGLIPTMAPFPVAGKYFNNFGMGGPVPINQDYEYEEGSLDDPNYVDIDGQRGGEQKPMTVEEIMNDPLGAKVDPTTIYLMGALNQQRDDVNNPELYAKNLKVFEDYATRMADKKQKYGLQAQLAGFYLKGLPDMIKDMNAARNRYMDANVQTIREAPNAANAFMNVNLPSYKVL